MLLHKIMLLLRRTTDTRVNPRSEGLLYSVPEGEQRIVNKKEKQQKHEYMLLHKFMLLLKRRADLCLYHLSILDVIILSLMRGAKENNLYKYVDVKTYSP